MNDAPRNKPGGMAWVRFPEWMAPCGVTALNGTAVCTESKVMTADGTTAWKISPTLHFTVTGSRRIQFDMNGEIAAPGTKTRLEALGDEYLEPWRDMDWDGKDESAAWLKPPPRIGRIEVPVRVKRWLPHAPYVEVDVDAPQFVPLDAS